MMVINSHSVEMFCIIYKIDNCKLFVYARALNPAPTHMRVEVYDQSTLPAVWL
jgi:hypothetical protein